MWTRKAVWMTVVAVAALVSAAAFLFGHRTRFVAVPSLRNYAQLPPAFAERLRTLHEQAASRGDAAALRDLARLYQANRLDDEARVCYRALAAIRPGLTAKDHYFLADLALNAGDLPSAQTELQTTLAGEPGYRSRRSER